MINYSPIQADNTGREYVLTFRRAPSLQPGNILLTSQSENKIIGVYPEGETVRLLVAEMDDTNARHIVLQNIDYVYIKLLL